MLVYLPFIATLLLGRTIDLRTYKISTGIFNEDQLEKETRDEFDSNYYVNDDVTSQYFELTGMFPDVVLRIKAGFMNYDNSLDGVDDLFINTYWKDNTVYVSLKIKYLNELRKLTKDAEMFEDNKEAVRLANCTHYVDELFYGGLTIVVYEFTTNHPSDKKMVQSEITKEIGVIGKMDDNFINKFSSLFEKLKKLPLRGQILQQYRVYSTTPIPSYNFSDPANIRRMINEYRENFVENQRAMPIEMTLKPLNKLDAIFDAVDIEYDSSNNKQIRKFTALYDDLTETGKLTSSWINRLGDDLSDEEENQIEELNDNIIKALETFQETISEVSQFKKLDKKMIEGAFEIYEKNLPTGKGTYNLAYRILKERIGAICDDEFRPGVLGHLILDSDDYLPPKDNLGENKCRKWCLDEPKCRAYAYGENLKVLDLDNGVWELIKNRCWILFRSSSTASFQQTKEISGDIYTNDRSCV